jgi:hypothetical protein
MIKSMMKSRTAVVLSGMIVLSSCAVTYPYKYYSLHLADEMLLGPEPELDLPLSDCSKSGSCIVIFTEEHRRIRQAYLKLARENESLKRQCGSKCK